MSEQDRIEAARLAIAETQGCRLPCACKENEFRARNTCWNLAQAAIAAADRALTDDVQRVLSYLSSRTEYDYSKPIYGSGLIPRKPDDEALACANIVRRIAAADRVAGEHDYISTACLHGLHHRCRKTCKFCGVSCRCECHAALAVSPVGGGKNDD